LHACGGGGGGIEPGVPTDITVDPASVSFTALGQTEQLSPTVVDGQGTPLPDELVTWTTSDSAVANVTADGLVTAEGAGTAQVTASAGSVNTVVEVEVVQAPSQLQKVAGDGQAGTPGQMIAIRPAVAVKDATGNGVPGVQVTFEVVSGGGSITGGSTTTNSSGIAEVGGWTLGSTGPNVLRATAAGSGISGNPAEFTVTAATAFNIEVRFLGSITPTQQQAFAEAEARWEGLVTGDLPNVQLVAEPADCGLDSPAINEVVDDLIILVTLEDIDGPGKVVGSAGPCFIRFSNDLPVLGAMQFDTADLESVEAAGLLSQAILHEMGHVLGFGSLWAIKGFLADPSLTPQGEPIEGADPHFTGPGAIAAFDQIGGSAYSGAKVPVADTGGVGTADGHWRESVFDNELMTGNIDLGQNPLSRVTVASLGDMGFVVNENAADNFSLSLAFARSAAAHRLELRNDLLRVPVRKVDANGRVMRVLRP
jgi:Leishmanolysin/Bacterial Ig-like domain (group 2)